MPFAEVVVNDPASRGASTFHYSLPAGFSVRIGQMVWVPFGQQQLQGIVVGMPDTSPIGELKEVAGVVDAQPVLSPQQVQLAYWIAYHYLCPLIDAVRLMVPPGISQNSVAFVELPPKQPTLDDLTPKQQAVVDLLQKHGRLRIDSLPRFGSGLRRAALELARRGIVLRRTSLERAKVRPKVETLVALTRVGQDREQAAKLLSRAPQQLLVLDFLLSQAQAHPLPLSQVQAELGCTRQAVMALAKKGLAQLEEREVWRDPLAGHSFGLQDVPQLTAEQQVAWDELSRGLAEAGHKLFLLHGVTGSGKTELYIRALAETLRQGKGAIILVPEIALTPQTVHRFASRFPGRIAIQHSHLSAGERYDQWRRIREGAANVVIGSRSAVFSPVRDLGLIILDEEHEWTYKQSDKSPRYDAREVARRIGELTGAKVILGSATPDLVSYHRTQRGQAVLLRLTERVQGGAMPPVHVVDMRQELQSGNRSIFSRALYGALDEVLAAREQAILFINRRGTSTFIICRDCGHILKCRWCDMPLVYHIAYEGEKELLLCHQCNRAAKVLQTCPECGGGRIRYFGIGTEKVETEMQRLFPRARVLRWDRDVTKGKMAHEEILGIFARHEADILVGTQMIAKGLDLPLVTLVGVVAADTILHLPDFRAAERTFQLLAQVAGRAGRRDLPGRVIVQTYSPNHYAVEAASLHDYHYFYQRELDFRRQHDYPPFGQLARLLYASPSYQRAQAEAEQFGRVLQRQVEVLGLPGTDVLGPAPAFRTKIRGKYRWQIILRGARVYELLHSLNMPPHWVVDVDPASVL